MHLRFINFLKIKRLKKKTKQNNVSLQKTFNDVTSLTSPDCKKKKKRNKNQADSLYLLLVGGKISFQRSLFFRSLLKFKELFLNTFSSSFFYLNVNIIERPIDKKKKNNKTLAA